MRNISKILVLTLGLLGANQAFAFRTSLFPQEVQDRAAVWVDQDRLEDRTGPIWLQAGDSLASGWANRSSLRERLANAERGELSAPGSFADLATLITSPRYSWYAGSDLGYGLLGRIETQTAQSWTVVSTALAGALAAPTDREDAWSLLNEVRHPERVRLVTLSLGSNDLCQDVDPAADEAAFRAKLRAIKGRISPQALWVLWDLIDVATIYQAVTARLAALPDSIGKRRLQAYCEASWHDNNCPAAKDNPLKTRLTRAKLQRIYTEEFGPLWDPTLLFVGHDLLDLMGSDCFHPARAAHPMFADSLAQEIALRGLQL